MLDSELEIRIEYLVYAITGKKTAAMVSIEKRYPRIKFTRLDYLRRSLTHWMLWRGKSGWFMLFPYGARRIFVSRKKIEINCKLFEFYWQKEK